jgi:hypothetical protein
MRRVEQLLWLLGVFILSTNAFAEETANLQQTEGKLIAQAEPAPEGDAAAEATGDAPAAEEPSSFGEPPQDAEPTAEADVVEPEPEPEPVAEVGIAAEAEVEEAEPEPEEDSGGVLSGWEMDFHGYFRAPMMIGLSKRKDNPGDPDSSENAQVVLAPKRLVDAGYSSFAFTRLNEGDWGEIHVSAKRPHVTATISFMGWWYQFVAHQQEDAIFCPGLAWIALDTDFNLGSIRPHIELKMGSFRQVYGAFGVYDTYMFGRHHMSGENITLTLPFSDNFELTFRDGVGYTRGGSDPSDYSEDDSNNRVPSGTGITMVHHLNLSATIKKMLTIGLYHNYNWTRDPTLFQEDTGVIDQPYSEARKAKMALMGADIKLNASRVGNLWFAYSHISIENGWALVGEATEVMHSPGGAGIAGQYMSASGDGSMNNLGWTYNNTLSNLRGLDGPAFPELTLNLWGMLAAVSRDLADGEVGLSDKYSQLKGGMDITLHPVSWMGIMLRYDGVKLDDGFTDDAGHLDKVTYHIITPRIIFSSHLLSSETLWIQYSHYLYGDDINAFAGMRPDANVIKMQCNIGW